MNRFRTATLAAAIAALAAAPGCRTAGVRNVGQPEALPPLPYDSAAELLDEHNRNAERIQNLEARPSIGIAGRRFAGKVDGRLAFERPRNFTLELSSMATDVAKIGSNQDEFWFWFKDAPEKAVMYCNYDESGKSPLAAGLQPDWIVEALGLRVVSEAEAAGFKIENGKEPGTVVLTERQTVSPTEQLVKETVISTATRRIVEHRVFSSDRKAKTLLAQARVMGDYQSVPVPDGTGETVYLPQKIQLTWSPQEKVVLDITLSSPKINQPVSDEQRQDRFSEPDMGAAYGRQNLVAVPGPGAGIGIGPGGNVEPATPQPPTSVRETLPAPPPRVNLRNPTPIGQDTARQSSPRDPVSLTAADRPRGRRPVDEVLGAPVFTGNETDPDPAPPPRWRAGLDASREQ